MSTETEVIAFSVGELSKKEESDTTNSQKKKSIPFEEAEKFYKTHAVDFSQLKKWTREELYE